MQPIYPKDLITDNKELINYLRYPSSNHIGSSEAQKSFEQNYLPNYCWHMSGQKNKAALK